MSGPAWAWITRDLFFINVHAALSGGSLRSNNLRVVQHIVLPILEV